jgi:hypothetical protein
MLSEAKHLGFRDSSVAYGLPQNDKRNESVLK